MSQWPADGLLTAPAPQLVATGLTPAHAVTLRLRMAVRTVKARRAKRATWGPVQVVRVVVVNDDNGCVLYFMFYLYAYVCASEQSGRGVIAIIQ